MRRENGSWQCHRINSLFVVNFDFHVQVTSFMNKESLILQYFHIFGNEHCHIGAIKHHKITGYWSL